MGTQRSKWWLPPLGAENLLPEAEYREEAMKLTRFHPELRRHRSRIFQFPGASRTNFRLIPEFEEFGGLDLRSQGKSVLSTYDLLRRVYSETTDACAVKSPPKGGFLDAEAREPVSAYKALLSSMAHATELTLPPFHSRAKSNDYETSDDRSLFEDMVQDYFSKPEPTGISHPGYGSTSAPQWVTDRAEKLALIEGWVRNVQTIRDHTLAGEWQDLDKKYGVMNLTFLQTRRQPEDPEKVRPLVVFDTLRGGDTISATKRISDPSVPPEFGAARLRLVYATSASMNWPFGTYQLYPFLKSFLNRYQRTFKVRGIPDMREKLTDTFPISVDVEGYDTRQPICLLETFFSQMADKLGEEWTTPCFQCFASPILMPPASDQSKPMLFGKPYSGPWLFNRGLPSGHAANVPYGRIAGAFLMIVALIRLGFIKSSDWRSVLKGEHGRIRVLNSSDDCVFLARDEADRKKIRDYFSMNQHPYFDVDVDDYFQYLGMIGYVREKRLEVALKTSSYLARMLAPERPAAASSRFRMYPWTGFKSREELYMSGGNPSTSKAREIWRRVFRDHTGSDWDDLVTRGALQEGLLPTRQVDLEALANPEALHYKVEAEQLSPETKEALTLTIPYDFLARTYSHVYR